MLTISITSLVFLAGSLHLPVVTRRREPSVAIYPSYESIDENGVRYSLGQGSSSLVLSCPGRTNTLRDSVGSRLGRSVAFDLTPECCDNYTGVDCRIERDASTSTLVLGLGCSRVPKSSVRNTGEQCTAWAMDNTKGNLHLYGFETGQGEDRGFASLYSNCYNSETSSSMWVRHTLRPHLSSVPGLSHYLKRRPTFVYDTFTMGEGFDPSHYTLVEQRQTLGEIIADTDTPDDKKRELLLMLEDDFFSRGHLAPRADFALEHERRATFRYSNTLPQPQTLNAGPWYETECLIRQVSKVCRETQIETGVWGTQVWNDVYLDEEEERTPVPSAMYKEAILCDGSRILVTMPNTHHRKPDELWKE